MNGKLFSRGSGAIRPLVMTSASSIVDGSQQGRIEGSQISQDTSAQGSGLQ